MVYDEHVDIQWKTENRWQVRHSGVPEWFHTSQRASSLAWVLLGSLRPPARRKEKGKRERLYIYSDVAHTHTPCLWQGSVLANEVKMRMKRGMRLRWEWKWDERLLNRDPRRGIQKKRERANTNTNTPGLEPANPERARKKKGGGRRKRLNQPNAAKLTPTSSRTGPDLPGEGRTHEIGDRRGN